MLGGDASLGEISAAVAARVGEIPPSSVRSYLNLNVPNVFERTGRGRYRLKFPVQDADVLETLTPAIIEGLAILYQADCFEWLARQETASIHAVVTDPPYGLLEYL